MEPRKHRCGVDAVNPAEDHIAGPVLAWVRRSAGVEERGMYAKGSSRNLGGLVSSTVAQAAWAPR